MSSPTTNTPPTTTTNTPTTTTTLPPLDVTSSITITQINETIPGTGYVIQNQQGQDAQGNTLTNTTFNTTQPEIYDPNITENLTEKVDVSYVDNYNAESNQLLTDIKHYAGMIQCTDFQGKGSIDDYQQLFAAASQIAHETKQMQLDVDVAGFNEFAAAADELSTLFENFTTRLQNISIINDINFLRAVSAAMKKIYNLSEVFGRFKKTIIATSTIKVPKSVLETKEVLNTVSAEINCAMQYINNFVNPDPLLVNGQLSAEEKNIISKAVDTIDNWKTLCDQGVSIALATSPEIQRIKDVNADLKSKTNVLKAATSSLRAKLAAYNL